MKRLARVLALALAVSGSASAQPSGWVEPHWDHLGSAVCPNRYDYHSGWCKPRAYRQYGQYGPARSYGYRGYGYGGVVPPQWTYDGSAVCPNGYDYRGGACRARSPYFESGSLPPRWTYDGRAVCPPYYDFIGHRCRPRAF